MAVMSNRAECIRAHGIYLQLLRRSQMTDKPDIERRTLLRGIAAVSGTVLSSALLSRRAVAQPTHVKKGQTPSQNSTNVILTHGAWADGSSWAKVILPLERHGLEVVAAPIPLTSFSDDIAALERAIERTNGPVILAAHAYAGAVISAVKNERVKSLVYVAALTPDQGETVGDMFYRGKPHPKAPHLAPDTNGLIWMPKASFGEAFAQNAPSDMIAILASTQRPIALRCIQETAPEPAWKTKPSWFLVAEQDRMINPETQHFMAKRMGAKIRSHAVDHTSPVTAPEVVVEIILEAVTNPV
jgi:pimeloyl-ACP methyl ester carboxylesterase